MNSYIIKDQDLEITLLDYGATVHSIRFGGAEVALSYKNNEDYIQNPEYLGATVGRVANRIRTASFILNGKEYHLSRNQPDGGHHHGGVTGLSKTLWQVREQTASSLTFGVTLADGQDGYPGNLTVEVQYALKENALSIAYRAICDQDTLFSPTNHTYFNLAGGGSVEEHTLWINADRFTPLTPTMDPTGEIRSLDGSALDFRSEKPLGRDIDADEEQIRIAGGFDHSYCLCGAGYRKAASLYCPQSGIRMDCFTDRPCLQIYTTNGPEHPDILPRTAVCLETQGYPNAVNHPQFPSIILKAGEEFRSVTSYRFKMK